MKNPATEGNDVMTTPIIRIKPENIARLLGELRELDSADAAAGVSHDWTTLLDDTGDIRRIIEDAFEQEVLVWSNPAACWGAGASDRDCDDHLEVWLSLSARWPVLTSHAEKGRWWIGIDSHTRGEAVLNVLRVFVETIDAVVMQAAKMVAEWQLPVLSAANCDQA